MTALEQIRAATAAASQTTDRDLAAIWIASARVVLDRHKNEIAAAETLLSATERELVRVTHGDAEQLKLTGGKP